MAEKKPVRKFRQYAKYILINILIAALISIFLVRYVASAYKIEGNSMASALHDQERVIVSKIGVRNGSIKRFDIVVLQQPNEAHKSIIKRVIGLPGEIIEIRGGEVYIDSEKLAQPFLAGGQKSLSRDIQMVPLLIRQGHYFVIGDNRRYSIDSRNFGEVPASAIYGKAIFRYWPLSRFGRIE